MFFPQLNILKIVLTKWILSFDFPPLFSSFINKVTSDPRLSSGPQAQSFNPTMSSQKLTNTASSLLLSRQTCLIWTILATFLDHYSFSSQVHSPVHLLSCHKSKSIQLIAKHMSWNIHYQVYTISTFPKQPCTTWLHNLFPLSGSPFAQFLITEFDIKL